jgi:hypothetical protein
MPGRKDGGRRIFSELVLRRLVYEIDIIVSDCEEGTTHVDNPLEIFQILDFFLEAGYNMDLTQMKWLICEGRCRESENTAPGILALKLLDMLHHSVID